MSFFDQFGGKPSAHDLARYQQSPNWRDGAFCNLEPTPVAGSLRDLPRMIIRQLLGRQGRVPAHPLPIAPFSTAALERDDGNDGNAALCWFGHSAVLLRINGKTLLIDPMLGPDTTPIAPMATKRFSPNTLDLIDQFPEIDLVLLTHDHYDHLDLASIRRLKSKTHQFAVALGVRRHLTTWGIEAERVVEFDWWDTQTLHDIDITFTPTRHFSGRGLRDRHQSLWGGWALRTDTENIWFSGDGGYGQHFKEIGARLGPFDFALMECGQYNDDWPALHMFPEESVQAALDANAAKAMPVHCAGFCLSYQHGWSEPLTAFHTAAVEAKLPYLLPPLGRVFTRSDQLDAPWWTTPPKA